MRSETALAVPITRWFHLSVYSLSLLAVLILGIADGNAFPYVVSLPIGMAAFYFTAWRGQFTLPISVANVCGIVSFISAATEFMVGGLEARLLSLAHLLVYISWIVSFLEPNRLQHFWWMVVLSFLQVAVGAVLTTEIWFGVALLVYVLAAIWTVMLFSHYQAVRIAGGADDVERVSLYASKSDSARRDDAGRPTSSAQSGIQADAFTGHVGLRLIRSVFATSTAAMILAAIFFALIPRTRVRSHWLFSTSALSGGPGISSITGFSNAVQLGAMGRILERTDRVMVVRFSDATTGGTVSVADFASRFGYDEPLFRGSVLAEYANEQWNAEDGVVRTPVDAPVTPGCVLQEYRVEAIGHPILFAMSPFDGWVRADTPIQLLADPDNGILKRTDVQAGLELSRYVLVTRSPARGSVDRPSLPPVPGVEQFSEVHRWYFRRRYLGLPAGLDELRALSRQVAEVDSADSLSPSEVESVADRLLTHLRDSGEYSYSLAAPPRDGRNDPNEDFLFDHKRGHCEYFASALALMLRSVDIPARLINGFKGGTENRLTGNFEVEQRHAHAWVEAFTGDRWLVLDPTPADRSASVQAMVSGPASLHDIKQLLIGFWNQYVVQFSITQQKESLYDPAKQAVLDAWQTSGRNGSVSRLLATLSFLARNPRAWVSWQGGIVAFVLLTFVTALVWLGRRLATWVRPVRRKRRRAAAARRTVRFYQQFERIAASHALVRQTSQTHREFAEQVRGVLVDSDAPQLAHIPSSVTALYYDIRFGQEILERGTLDTVEADLNRLAHDWPKPSAKNGQ